MAQILNSMPQLAEFDYSKLPVPDKEGNIPLQVASAGQECYTYYKVYGDLKCGAAPLLCVHGGPGAGHEGMLPFATLWAKYGVPVIVYDQIGCGKSTHLRHKAGDHSFWTLELWLNELENLIKYFKLSEGPGYNLLGHSWGGMLSSFFAGTQPNGLRRLILSSANASKVLSASSCLTLRLTLPPDVQKTLTEKEAAEEFDDPAYRAAMGEFYKKYLFIGSPPPELALARKNLQDDPTVTDAAQGRALVLNEGSLRTFNAIPNLHKIQAPTLVINGDSDASSDISTEPFFELIPRVRWITLPNAAHAHLSDPAHRARTARLVGEFITPEKLEDRARQRGWYDEKPRAMPERLEPDGIAQR